MKRLRRFNEFFYGSAPVSFIQYATTGVVSTDGNYKVITLSQGNTFSVTAMPVGSTFEVFANAGGGGGGAFGGGGGGEWYHNLSYSAVVGSYTFSIGAGGAGSIIGSLDRGVNGSNTVFGGITLLGGGTGGGFSNTLMDGLAGGNGGGGGCKVSPTFAKGLGGTGTFNGGTGDSTNSATSGGGGGGGGGNGSNGGSLTGGQGGNGYLNSITGIAKYYGAGGGGAGATAGAPGGVDGGGAGESYPGAAATAGTFYGAGGGGGYAGNRAAGAGYAGVIIIRIKFQEYAESKLFYIFQSQSNSTDHGIMSGTLPLEMQSYQRDFLTYYKTVDNSADNGTWVTAVPGVNTQTGAPQTGKFSFMVSMANRLKYTYNLKTYSIPTGVGGTYVANDIIPSWNAAHVGEYYDRSMTDHYLPAVSKLASPIEPIGIIIHGESDSDTVAHGQTWLPNTQATIAKVRLNTGYPNMKFIVVKTRSDYAGPNLGLTDLRTGMDSLALADPYVTIYDADTVRTPLTDGQHYTDLGYIHLGEDLADIAVIL